MRAAKENVLDKLFNNRTQYSVPVYQRNYGWTRENCETLYNDIVALVGTDKKHFVGTVAVVAKPENNGIHQYLIIDGQQRFTTPFLLIRAIFDSAGEEDVYTKAQCNELLFNIDHYKDWTESDLNRIKLKPIKSDNEQLMLLMEHRFAEMLPNSPLKRNYDLLKELLAKSYKKGLMPRDVLNAIKKLECVEIILDEDDAMIHKRFSKGLTAPA